jgi:hypothetical protein
MKTVGVDVGSGQRNLLEPRPRERSRRLRDFAQGVRERMVAHAVRDEVDLLGAGSDGEILEKPSQVADRPLHIVPIGWIRRHLPDRGPGVEDRRAEEPEVVRDLRSPVDRIVERDVVAVHEDEGFPASRPADDVADLLIEAVVGQKLAAHDDKVLVEPLAAERPDRRPLDVGHAVIARHAHVEAPEPELAAAVAAASEVHESG